MCIRAIMLCVYNVWRTSVITLLVSSRSESLTAETHSVQSNSTYKLTKSRSESDLSQPDSDEEVCAFVSITVMKAASVMRNVNTRKQLPLG